MVVKVILAGIDEELCDKLSSLFIQENIKVIKVSDSKEAKSILHDESIFLIISTCSFPSIDSLIMESKALDMFRPIVIIKNPIACNPDLLYMGINIFYDENVSFNELSTQSLNLITLYHAKKDSKSQNDVFSSLSIALEVRDPYTHGHGERVSRYATELYDALGFKDFEDRESLRFGCIIHDVGKIGTPDNILKSGKKIDEDEFVIVKNHPQTGVKICRDIVSNEKILDIIQHHHEKLDGSGYPYGLKGNEISYLTQIVSICDVYDALTSDRSYRVKNTDEEAISIMDKAFINHLNADYYNTFKILLNSGILDNIKH